MVHDWCETILLDPGLGSIVLAEDLGTISVLAVEVAIFVLDEDNFVLSYLCHDPSLLVSLIETVDPWEVSADSILVFSTEALVVSDSPFEFSSAEMCMLTIGVEYFSIKIVEVSYHYTASEIDSIDFGGGLWVLKRAVLDLHDITIWHMADDQAVFHRQVDAWTSSSRTKLLVFEQCVQEVWRTLLKYRLRLFFFNHFDRGSSFLGFGGCSSSCFCCLLFGCYLLCCWLWWLDFDELLWVSRCLYGLNQQLGFFVLEVQPELMLSNGLVADKTMLLGNRHVLLLL